MKTKLEIVDYANQTSISEDEQISLFKEGHGYEIGLVDLRNKAAVDSLPEEVDPYEEERLMVDSDDEDDQNDEVFLNDDVDE